MGLGPEEAGLVLPLSHLDCPDLGWEQRARSQAREHRQGRGWVGSSLRQLASPGEFGWGQARGGAAQPVPGQCQGIPTPAATHCRGTRDSVWPGINDPFLGDLQGRLAPTSVLHPAYVGAQLQAA